jgi:predicted ribosome quality control (RQC) complex YloA/Tae2 family protein
VELLQLEEYRKRAELLRRQAELVAADAHQVATGHSDAH